MLSLGNYFYLSLLVITLWKENLPETFDRDEGVDTYPCAVDFITTLAVSALQMLLSLRYRVL